MTSIGPLYDAGYSAGYREGWAAGIEVAAEKAYSFGDPEIADSIRDLKIEEPGG